jgi:hypothetical protein
LIDPLTSRSCPYSQKEVAIDVFSSSDPTGIDDRRRLDEWRPAGGTITPVARALIAQAHFALDEIQRCKRLLAVLRIETARTAEIRYREAREDDVRYYIQMFGQDAHSGVAGLKRSAAGVRHLISRWEELRRCLDEEGTWYGAHRCEAILMQGFLAGVDQLFLSEAAWQTWMDCLACQPLIRQSDINMLCDSAIVPKAILDRQVPLWQPDPEASRARLRALVDRELPPLVALEAELRTRYEEPGLAAAQDMALARLTHDETALLRALRSHEGALVKAMSTLEKLGKAARGAPPRLDAALVIPQACDCDDPAGRPPPRGVPILPPFARQRTEAAASQVHGGPVCRNTHRHAGPSGGTRGVAALGPSHPAVYRTEAAASQVHGGPVCRNAYRQAAVQCRPSLREGGVRPSAKGRAFAPRRPTPGQQPVHRNEAGATQIVIRLNPLS